MFLSNYGLPLSVPSHPFHVEKSVPVAISNYAPPSLRVIESERSEHTVVLSLTFLYIYIYTMVAAVTAMV